MTVASNSNDVYLKCVYSLKKRKEKRQLLLDYLLMLIVFGKTFVAYSTLSTS